MHKLRIGLDGRALSNINRYRGIGKYTVNILRSLVQSGDGYRFVVFGYDEQPDPDLLPADIIDKIEWIKIRQAKVPAPVSILEDHLYFAKTVNEADISIFHGIDHNMTPFLSCPSIITVHDLILLIVRGPYLGPTSWMWMKFHRSAARRASAVITVSNSTKRDVMHLWNIPEKNIRTVYEGVDERYAPDADPEDISIVNTKCGLDCPYFLYIGGFDPRKNIGNMLVGFKRFLIRNGPTHKLLLCGDTKGFEDYLNDEIEQLGIREHVVTPGFLPDSDLPAFYRNATALLFVSTYEGFGLPLLESMACGTPVITAENSSIPEIAGAFALYVDPLEPLEIAEGMQMLAGDEALRNRLVDGGLERSKRFTWSKTACEILDLYTKILGEVV